MSGESARHWARRIAGLLPPLLVTCLVARFAVDVPYWDTWEWLDRHYPADPAATTLLARYWEPFNGHRVFLSLLLDRALLWASGIGMLPRILVKLPLSFITLTMVLGLARSTMRRPPGVLVTAALAALCVPLPYWPMWMDPRQFSIHIVVLSLTAAIVVARGPLSAASRATATALLCIVASLSYGPGVLTWPAVLLVLLAHRPRPTAPWLVSWVCTAAVVTSLQMVAVGGGRLFEPTAPASSWASLHAMSAIAGLPVAPSLAAAHYRPTRVLGLAGIGLFVLTALALCRSTHDARRRATPWMALGSWGALYALAAAMSRGGLPLASLHDPRFAYGSAVLWVGNVGLVCLLLERMPEPEPQAPAARSAAHGVAVRTPWLVGLAVTTGAVAAIGHAAACVWVFVAPGGVARLHDQLIAGRACLAPARRDDDACLQRLHPSAERVRSLTTRLEGRDAAFLRSMPRPRADNRQAGTLQPR